MQLLAYVTLLVSSFARRQIRFHTLIPHPQPREDMRRHMKGMRRGRSYLRIRARDIDSLAGHFSVVISVDQIMRNSRMLRID